MNCALAFVDRLTRPFGSRGLPAQRVGGIVLLLATATAPACSRPAAPPKETRPAPAARDEKTAHVYRGRVESVEPARRMMTVNGEDVPGWMSAMPMLFKVEPDTAFDKVKPGDRIVAKVYDNDFQTLYELRVETATENPGRTPAK